MTVTIPTYILFFKPGKGYISLMFHSVIWETNIHFQLYFDVPMCNLMSYMKSKCRLIIRHL